MNTYQKIVVLLMVTTGTLNTVSAGLQIARQGKGIDGDYNYFEHPFVQTLFMMLGECLCMVAYLILKYVVYKDTPEVIDGPDAKPMNPLVLWPAAFLDIFATGLGYLGMIFMANPGFFQMLRCTPIIWCGLLSIPFLGQRLKANNWIGIGILSTGLMIKAIPDAVKPFVDYTINGTDIHPDGLGNILPDDPHGWEFCNFRLGVPTFSSIVTRPLDPLEEDSEEMSAAVKLLVGIALVIVAEFFHGVQFVYESKYLTKYNLPPLKVVGLEGINGALTLCVLLWPAYFLQDIPYFGVGPNKSIEDMLDGLHQIFAGDNGGWTICWTLGNMCSIAVFNYAGITVMKELTATTRAVLDQIRVILIYIVFLIPFGPFLCKERDHFVFVAPIGLVILIIGVFIYNDILIMPAYRKWRGIEEPEKAEKDAETKSEED